MTAILGQFERDVEMIQRGFKDLDELLSCAEFKDSYIPTKCVDLELGFIGVGKVHEKIN